MRVGTQQKSKHPWHAAPQNQLRMEWRKGRDRHESKGAPHMLVMVWTGQGMIRSVIEARD